MSNPPPTERPEERDICTIALPRTEWAKYRWALECVIAFANVTHQMQVESEPLVRVASLAHLIESIPSADVSL